jgi:hypothetical protein
MEELEELRTRQLLACIDDILFEVFMVLKV